VSDNIIDFNKAFEKKKKIQEAIEKDVFKSDEEFIDFYSTLNARETVWGLRGFGIDVEEDPRAMLDILTIMEATKALMWRSKGKEYPFQTFADTVFADVEKESGVKIRELFDHFIEDMETYYEELGDWED
jgi:hypothetical protein